MQLLTAQEYLSGINTDCLAEEEREVLEDPVALEEVLSPIKSLASGKAAGPDQIPIEFYKIFLDRIQGDMLFTMLQAQTGASVPGSWAGADIVVILKKGKISTEPGSYRPITLMNADAKFFSKVLAFRLSRVIEKMVSVNQHGFIPGRGTTHHIRKVITLFDQMEVSGDPMEVLLLDAEKAFDRVSWDFLWAVMRWKGIGDGFIRAVQALYRGPTARVRINRGYSVPLQIKRGTKQGCPCSPLLFALYLEPLIQQLEINTKLPPLVVNGVSYKTLAYADDVAIVTPTPDVALKEIEIETTLFGRVSGYALNKGKTQIIKNSRTICNDPRVVASAVYLGIDISADLDHVVEKNIVPIIDKVKRDLDRMHNLHLSLVGRVNIIKMCVLPKFLYIFRAIPLLFESKWFTAMELLTNRFIWAHGKTRRALRFMALPRDRVGWAVPDFRMYYCAAALQYMRGLIGGGRDDLKAKTESIEVYGIVLGREAEDCFLKFTEPSYFKTTRFKTVIAARKIWMAFTRKNGLGRINSYIRIIGNPIFPEEISSDSVMREWGRSGVWKLGDLLGENGFLQFHEIQKKYGVEKTSFFKYLQLRSFISSKRGGPAGFGKNKIMDIIEEGEDSTIRRFSSELIAGRGDDLEKRGTKWAEKLEIEQDGFLQSLELGQLVLQSAWLQAQHYKTIYSLYYTPGRIAQWGGTAGITCPHCDSFGADIIHIFSTCPQLYSLRTAVERFMEENLGIRVSLSSAWIILGVGDTEDQLVCFFLFMAMAVLRLCIARAWLHRSPPTFQQWLATLLSVYNLEKGIYAVKGRKGRALGIRIWEPIRKWKEEVNR